jgi:hypothetical protein
VFLHDELRVGLAENSGQLENMDESPVPKPLIGVMLRKVVLTN